MSLPTLDVSRVLNSPFFKNTTLTFTRNTQTIDAHGRATNTGATAPLLTPVVTQDMGAILKRIPESAYKVGSILVHTGTPVTVGRDDLAADIITYKGANFTVAHVGDYSEYGRGFVWAVCEPLSIPGAGNG